MWGHDVNCNDGFKSLSCKPHKKSSLFLISINLFLHNFEKRKVLLHFVTVNSIFFFDKATVNSILSYF